MPTRRTVLTGAAAAAGLTLAGLEHPARAMAAPSAHQTAKLTNLDHLRWLCAEVPLRETTQHTTYRINEEPRSRTPWTYADAQPTGGWRYVGGGSFDATTGHWSQGAYNADDIARAAVVFIRDLQATGSAQSRQDAIDMLRTLTYLQTATGPNAGNVVLWMQSDGTLNPSAIPVELPDPSDSAESFWLARTVWALGEAYPAFRDDDPAFANFLEARLLLAISAMNRGSLSRYGTWLVADGVRVPGWLLNEGADASAEACLGLAAYVEVVPGASPVTGVLRKLAEGVAAMRSGRRGVWPFGAVLPWLGSQSFWHAWGGAAPTALCRASTVLRSRSLLSAGLADAGQFTPLLLASGGAYNAWSPVPGEAQIAYGAEGRVAGLLAAADATGSEGFVLLGGLAGGWFFGANPSGQPTYDPASGASFDGVEVDGRVNRNSGAESTIHGLLAMQALDAHPAAARLAKSVTGYRFDGLRVVEAEAGVFEGGASVVTPAGSWTGSANWSNGRYVSVPAGASVLLAVDCDGDLVHPIINRRPGPLGHSRWYAVSMRGRRTLLGTLANGGLGATGTVQAEGMLRPLPLDRHVPKGTVSIVVESDGDLQFDALMIQPRVSTVAYFRKGDDAAALYVNAVGTTSVLRALARGTGRTYTANGEARARVVGSTVTVTGGGFTITT